MQLTKGRSLLGRNRNKVFLRALMHREPSNLAGVTRDLGESTDPELQNVAR